MFARPISKLRGVLAAAISTPVRPCLQLFCGLATVLAVTGVSSVCGATINLGENPAPHRLQILPAPARLNLDSGSFVLNRQTKIVCADGPAYDVARYLQGQLSAFGWKLAIVAPQGASRSMNSIELTIESKAGPSSAASVADVESHNEAYRLEVKPAGITLHAASADGLFAGVVSIIQLTTDAVKTPSGDAPIPAMRIEDSPRFAWRGFMLDESRHFFGKAIVEEVLDTMAYLKMNRFHWHLTDEPGWRIEIRRYPLLTRIGAEGDSSNPKAPASFYTQEDIREIVAYAQTRHIMIVPEIDFPGHATAATRAYPELSGGGAGKWTGFTFNPTRENTYQFMTDVLREVTAIFPGPYLHIGGDEVSYGNQDWSTDPEMVRFTREHGLKSATELEGYAVRRVASIVHDLGKIPIGWDEIARDGVPPAGSVALWWHHEKPEVLQDLIVQKYPVVLCPRLPCYFDFVQASAHQVGRRWKGAYVDLQSVYRFPDVEANEAFPAASAPNINGIEACEWTEVIRDRDRLYFMLFPRLAALAESAWTPANAKDYSGFMDRLPGFLRELDRRGIPYFDPFSPTKTPEPAGPTKASGLTGKG